MFRERKRGGSGCAGKCAGLGGQEPLAEQPRIARKRNRWHPEWDEGRVIEALVEFREKHGRVWYTELREKDRRLAGAVTYYFGGVEGALEAVQKHFEERGEFERAAEFDARLNVMQRAYTKKRVVGHLIKVFEEEGTTALRHGRMSDAHGGLYHSAISRFGDYERAIGAVKDELERREHPKRGEFDVSKIFWRGRWGGWTTQRVAAGISAHEEAGDDLSWKGMRKVDGKLVSAAEKLFGSWQNALAKYKDRKERTKAVLARLERCLREREAEFGGKGLKLKDRLGIIRSNLSLAFNELPDSRFDELVALIEAEIKNVGRTVEGKLDGLVDKISQGIIREIERGRGEAAEGAARKEVR